MSQPRLPRLLGILVRVYRVLLWAYPAAFRKEYGEEMEDVFRDLAQDAWAGRGTLGVFSLAVRMVPDVLLSCTRQHVFETRRRFAMARVLLNPAYSVLVLALILLFSAFVTPADPVSMLLVGVPLCVVYLFVLFATRGSRPGRGDGSGEAGTIPRKERME